MQTRTCSQDTLAERSAAGCPQSMTSQSEWCIRRTNNLQEAAAIGERGVWRVAADGLGRVLQRAAHPVAQEHDEFALAVREACPSLAVHPRRPSGRQERKQLDGSSYQS